MRILLLLSVIVFSCDSEYDQVLDKCAESKRLAIEAYREYKSTEYGTPEYYEARERAIELKAAMCQ